MDPKIFVRGIDKVLKKDLVKHQALLLRSSQELDAYKEARTHLVKRKKYYRSLIGGGKFNDTSLQNSIDGLVIDLRHMSDKVKLSSEAMEHHSLIVDTLSGQLEEYNETLLELADAAIH